MFNKVMIKLLVVALVTNYCTCQDIYGFNSEHWNGVPPECRKPPRGSRLCDNYSYEKLPGYDLCCWYWAPKLKRCEPIYSVGGKKDCAERINHFASDKLKCENVCGKKPNL